MFAVRILGTGSVLPGIPRSTAELVAEAAPGRDVDAIVARTGIAQRYYARPEDTTTSVAAETIRHALEAAGIRAEDLRRLILATSYSGDFLCPATANAIADELGLRNSCDCFDVNNACMSFFTAFDLGVRSVATGVSPVAIVAAELTSRGVVPSDPRPYLVMGDAAGAAILGEARPGEGVEGIRTGNDGAHRGNVTLAHPVYTGKKETIHFHETAEDMTALALALIDRCVGGALDDAGLEMADIDWVVPHQPNGPMLGRIIEHLGVGWDRVIPVVREIGSVSAASIAVGLDRLWSSGRVGPGERVLIVGVGAGVSYGAAVYRKAP
jgi:3-oxoacyl-[acyl-carrier-protein] synthase III